MTCCRPPVPGRGILSLILDPMLEEAAREKREREEKAAMKKKQREEEAEKAAFYEAVRAENREKMAQHIEAEKAKANLPCTLHGAACATRAFCRLVGR